MKNDLVDNLRLDINKGRVRNVVYVRNGDTRTRTLHITIANNGLVYDLDECLIAEMLILKPDGNQCDQSMSRSGNELHYTLRTQDINATGECKCQVMLTFSDGAVVTSPEFSIMVYEKAIDPSKEKSTNEYTALTQQLVIATEAAEEAEASAQNAEAAHQAAIDVVNAVDRGLWYPTVNENGDVSWEKSATETEPGTVNIKGPQGPQGIQGETGPQGPTGAKGDTGNGIVSITKIGSSGLVDTYRIIFEDASHYDYTVENGEDGDPGEKGETGPAGNGIASIAKTGSVGMEDTYRITFTNGTYFDYTVTNGYRTTVAVNQIRDTGEKIATIDVDGYETDLFAPDVGGKVDDNPTFTEASTRANIVSGESFATILGKIKKFFTDLKTVAFTGAYSDLSGKPTIPTNTNQLTNGAGFITSSGSCESATKATQDGSGNTITSTYVPLKTSDGVGYQTGNGSYNWCRIATLKITGTYINGPIAFEVSQRQEPVTLIQVCFASAGNTDPALSYFITNNSTRYYIKKTATSTWELYCNYTETWGAVSLHRVFGYRYNNGVSVSIDFVNISTPTGITQVTPYFASYSTSILTVTKNGVSESVLFLGTENLSIELSWGNISGKPSSYTPASHASTGTGYGAGNASNYGHVKLSDTYASNVGAAANSIGASQTALYNVYSLLSPIGTITGGTVSSKSVASGTETEVAYITLNSGKYIFVCYGRFQDTSTTGGRIVKLKIASQTFEGMEIGNYSGWKTLNVPFIREVSGSNVRCSLMVTQSSGGAVTVEGSITAIRIK